MLTRVEVYSEQGSLLNLPLEDLSHGYLVDSIEGLGPVNATVTTASFAQLDGSEYQSSRREIRNINLAISLEPDYTTGETVRDMRQRLYSVLMPKNKVNLRFYDDVDDEVFIEGVVESFETSFFVQDPSVHISILCFDPDFKGLNDTSVSASTSETTVNHELVYAGSVETGIKFSMVTTRTLNDFTIYLQNSYGQLKTMDFNGSLASGDTIEISTEKGNKYVARTSSGVRSSVLYSISPQSDWLELTPGTNQIRVYALGTPIPYQIQYRSRYGGL